MIAVNCIFAEKPEIADIISLVVEIFICGSQFKNLDNVTWSPSWGGSEDMQLLKTLKQRKH